MGNQKSIITPKHFILRHLWVSWADGRDLGWIKITLWRVIMVLLSVCFLNLFRSMFRRRGKGLDVASCHAGNIVPGALFSLRELYSRVIEWVGLEVHQVIKISPQNADHCIAVPVSTMQGICLLPFCPHPFFPFTYPSSLSCSAALSLTEFSVNSWEDK